MTELRKAAIRWRLKGAAHWLPLHVAQVRHHISDLPERDLIEAGLKAGFVTKPEIHKAQDL